MKCSKKTLFILAAVLMLCGGIYYFNNRNPLKKYGVTYKKTYGAFESFQHITFYLKRNGKTILGPEIIGSDLYVTFKKDSNNRIPEIIVLSQDDKTYFTIIKLNLTDAKKPEFEIVKNYMNAINYSPSGYYWP